jgi:hypothetical protein
MLGELTALMIVLALLVLLLKHQPKLRLYEIKFTIEDDLYVYHYVYAESDLMANLYASMNGLSYSVSIVEPTAGLLSRSRSVPDVYSIEYQTNNGPYYMHILARTRGQAIKTAETWLAQHPPSIYPITIHRKTIVSTAYKDEPIIVHGGWG